MITLKEIASLGHEIGYHYEDMTICNGDIDKAFEHFKTVNLDEISEVRETAPSAPDGGTFIF